MSLPIIKLARKLVTGGTLKPVGWEFADSFTTTTANCSISNTGELLVPMDVAKVSLKANFPTGTTGTAFLAVKDKEPASSTKPTTTTGWTIIGSGVTIASNSATFELSMSDSNGLSTNVGICAYTIKNTSGVNAGTAEGRV
jgi:hypothetical protein